MMRYIFGEGLNNVIGGIVIILYSLLSLQFGSFSFIFGIPLGLLISIMGLFQKKGYHNKTFFLTSFSVLALWGFILVYIFLFMQDYYMGHELVYFLFAGVFACFIVLLTYSYLNRENESEPWKNEW